ncbi:polysaccharide biosynthesis/export family protein [Halocynthiibacter namhaensis]|uniref:polysaccharide biosynthesis/export family protein n=1 Tax=Halocynthiibacter namhaensis TaxID=1290553 RepID=UPI000578E424|nr:polysaccharide biosynthesis/export family protein [Halocynthiibacter namhaensis]
MTAVIFALTSCGLPRSGPSKREILAGADDVQHSSFIIPVTNQTSNLIVEEPLTGFSQAFLNASQIGSDTIRPGDTLGLSIWENVDAGVLGTRGAPSTLSELQVDGAGMIFVPYAGRVRAAGNTPEALRRIITEKLDDQTPDPQVLVTRLAGDGATVSIVGSAGTQGVFTIERPTRTLAPMLASAGGISIAPEIVHITVLRGSQRGTVWLEDLYENPELDIALRGNDRILVEADKRAYTTMGATGGQGLVPFESRELSAVEAIARVGGISTNTADPTGIFVFRTESAKTANAVLGRSDLAGPQRVAYILDLTKPNGVFIARDFMIRDEDTIYVTEAPFVSWNKSISALTGSLQSATAISSIAN